MIDRTYTAIDVFSGCGGLSEGLRQAGFTILGAIEIDEAAADVYRTNHPVVHVWADDVRDLDAKTILGGLGIRQGEIDLLAGCPPCQGFSSLRTLNGARNIEDSRNDLIFEYLRLVGEIKPKSVMMENVPGLAKDARFTDFVCALEGMGYFVIWDVLDAANYAVPQRRKRLICMASLMTGMKFAKPARCERTVRTAIGDLKPPGEARDKLHAVPKKRSDRVERLIKLIPPDGGSRTNLPAKEQLDCHQRCDGFKDVYGRLAWDRVAPTITTGCFNPSKGRFLHPVEHRSITMREAALLQTFPKSYQFPVHLGIQRIAEMIGNALPPEFIRRHAAELLRHLKKDLSECPKQTTSHCD